MIASSNKTEYINLLRSTNREGIENVIEELDNLGFFAAPASTNFHLNEEGGLVAHSLNVCHIAMSVRDVLISSDPDLKNQLPKESVIIASLLHDACKADVYKPALKKQKDKNGIWHTVEGYDVDYSNFPLGHGEKSVIMLLRMGLDLTNDEIIAIRWHMHAWDLPFQSYELKSNFNKAKEICPLLPLIQSADGLAANILENDTKEGSL